jgi:DNA polymerase
MRPRGKAKMDFETRSAADIRNGAWLYAKHKSTRILCLSFLLPGQDPLTPSLWAPAMGGFPAVEDYPLDENFEPYSLARLFEHIEAGGLVEAHNVNFEAMIWEHIAVRPAGGDEAGATGMGAPPLKDTQLRCTAARAASCALPRDLEGFGEAVKLPYHLRKETAAGRAFIFRHCKPRKARKGEPKVDEAGEPIVYWHDYDREEFLSGYRYCKQDVTAEHYAGAEIPELSEREYQVWLADFRANRRGVLIDMDLVEAAIALETELRASAGPNGRASLRGSPRAGSTSPTRPRRPSTI